MVQHHSYPHSSPFQRKLVTSDWFSTCAFQKRYLLFNMADGHEMYSSVINTLLRDNNHLTDTNTDLDKDLSSIRTINDEIIGLAMKNLKLSWAGDFESLKRVVSDYIKFDGRWSSPGGEKKVCSNPETSITWGRLFKSRLA